VRDADVRVGLDALKSQARERRAGTMLVSRALVP